LVSAFAAGPADALEHLYAEYGALAYAAAFGVLRDHARAEEVVQDSFMKLWRNWARFDPGRGSVKTWVLTSVRNRSVDYLRGRHAHERLEVELPRDARATGLGADPWRHVASLVDRSVLAEALASLPATQREAIHLAYFQGYRHPEIARLQGVPLSTVKGRLRLGIKKLHLHIKATGLVFDAAHEEIQALIGPYLAGTCENGETEVMEAHLPLCATCRQLARKLSRRYQRTSEPKVASAKGAAALERPTGSESRSKASPSAA
jgi:RNA polymerase sigma-70 factor (ECF subfamily)